MAMKHPKTPPRCLCKVILTTCFPGTQKILFFTRSRAWSGTYSPRIKDLHADFGAYCYKGLRHSLSHGWSCGPAHFLSERVLGVSFPEPGKVRIG